MVNRLSDQFRTLSKTDLYGRVRSITARLLLISGHKQLSARRFIGRSILFLEPKVRFDTAMILPCSRWGESRSIQRLAVMVERLPIVGIKRN